MARGLLTGGQGSKVYVLCAEPKEHKRFRPGARPGGSGTRPGGSVTGVTEKLFMCQMFMCLFRPLLSNTQPSCLLLSELSSSFSSCFMILVVYMKATLLQTIGLANHRFRNARQIKRPKSRKANNQKTSSEHRYHLDRCLVQHAPSYDLAWS